MLQLRMSDWNGATLAVGAAKGGRATDYSGPGLAAAVEAVLTLRRGRAVRGLTLFTTRNGTPYSSDGFRAIWQRAMRAYVDAGNARFTEHDLRAKVASDAGDAGRARDLLGHRPASSLNASIAAKDAAFSCCRIVGASVIRRQ